MLPCPYFDPIPANGIKWSHIWHFYSVNQSCHPYVSNRGASVVLPITPGRPGCPNMGSFWSLSFLPFVSLGYPLLSELPEGRACPWSCSCPRTLNGTTALPTISWCSPTWKTFQVVNHIAFTSCLKGLNYTVFCTNVEESGLLLKPRDVDFRNSWTERGSSLHSLPLSQAWRSSQPDRVPPACQANQLLQRSLSTGQPEPQFRLSQELPHQKVNA